MAKKRSTTGALDAAFLKELLKNPHVQIEDAESGQKIESEKDLNDLLAEENQKPAKTEKAQEKAQELADNPPGTEEQEQEQEQKLSDAEKAQRQRERDEEKAQQDVARRNRAAMSTAQKLIGRANRATAPVLQRAGSVVDQVSAARTPGGIGLLIIILIFLVFVVVIVDQAGHTRIQQLWYMLLGRAQLEGRVRPSTGANTGGSSGGIGGGTIGGNGGTIGGTPQQVVPPVTIPGIPDPVIGGIIQGIGLSYRSYNSRGF